MIGGDSDFDFIISEFERELATAEKLLMLPADVIGLSSQARKPLREEIDIGVVIGKVIVTTTTADNRFLDDVE